MPEMEKDIQEKFVLYQMLNQRLEQIKQHATIIQQKMIEFEVTKQALADLKNVKAETEMLVPLGSGIYSHGKSVPVEKILVDIGAGVMAKKTYEEASSFLEKRKKEIDDAVEMLQGEANAITAKLGEIVPELQKAAQDQQEGSQGAAG